ncbi:MAG: PEP-CTERM sorting domain-containing protein [Microcystis viridis Mv_BB_P_19951000_S69]|uniref:PEP-CTERM sorting domain-containing protein n=1 Tax=Microcystis viridis Mv_BB_P_19951000_S68D TaxID=2486270 RepID=A0A552I2I7_MICVR|nr:MAG: PEP-CTERM sorting domain-containing protein [Microcystis viridis Mv_BB_P_19951000_S69]TRU76884.1 MAG: PEP-CTERM sorting domain-containing protein [Microcystis viridis Mv_BB_P_19951000_S68]TRU77692.1 MAG: PEP-CTERM sorting domain-containing protein [Microcystis viridis Mv_BB_P_19951000_S68D]TRU90741.1 MAG: PEP-CTERM sorting domain-containing protein [Microcystis viridis Mv_BB_P_19951000_S69D]
MMTTNKLTKTFASGSLAIGVLAGAVLTATSASAVTLTWAAWTGGTPLEVGDKIVKYVPNLAALDPLNPIGAEPEDEVMLNRMGNDHYYFVYDAMNGSSPFNASSGSFTYTIEVINSPKSIVGVDLNSNVSSNYGDITEKFTEISNVLVSTNGLPVPLSGFEPIAPKKLLTVTNTLTDPMSPTEGLFQLQNSFHQSVPEPGTILGLLAVGGLGLVSRFKKQK